MNIEVESHEATAMLPELLRKIRSGQRYTITLRGEAVANLVPCENTQHAEAVAAVDELLAFMQSHQVGEGIDLKTLIGEGRA